MGQRVRRWRVHRHVSSNLADLARWMNPIVRGWMQYYGRFYRTELYPLLKRINTYLMRWARTTLYRPLTRSRASLLRWGGPAPRWLQEFLGPLPMGESAGVTATD